MLTPTDSQRSAAAAVLRTLQLTELPSPSSLLSGRRQSIPLIGESPNGRRFLLKYYIQPDATAVLPQGMRADDYAWRETGFYRLLDSVDPSRHRLPTPRTVAIGPGEPPQWLLLEWIEPARGPAEEVLSQDHVFTLLEKLAAMPTDRLVGRRGFPLEHWDAVSYLERVRGMYDSVLNVVGERRWRQIQSFFAEALRWTEGRRHVLVHGEFVESNIVVDAEGAPFLVDFENIGVGNEDHDFAWFWIHSERHASWKRQLLQRRLASLVGSDRIRAEWGMRSALAFLALRRVRWSYLTQGDEDPRMGRNLAMLDAAMDGGRDLFPV